MNLLTNQTTTGSSSSVYYAVGKRGIMAILGIFDGATATVEASVDGTTFAAITGAALTEPSVFAIDMPGACHLRVSVSNPGASTSITAQIN